MTTIHALSSFRARRRRPIAAAMPSPPPSARALAVALLAAGGLALGCGGAGGAGSGPGARTAGDTGSGPSDDEETLVNLDFLDQYAATYRFRLGHPAHVAFAPDGDEVLYLRSGPTDFVQNLYALDLSTGDERVVLTAEALLGDDPEELSDEEKARRERMRMAARGITRFELSRQGDRLLVPLSDQLYVVERPGGEVVRLPDDGGFPNAARLSPTGTHVATVRDGDLWVIDIDAGTQRRLTFRPSPTVEHGLAEFVAQEEMRRYRGFWWTPDGQRLVYQRTDLDPVETLHIMDPTRPEKPPRSFPYPRAGTDNAIVRLGVIGIEGGETTWLDWDRDAYPYLASVKVPKEGPVTLVVQDRRQKTSVVMTADLGTGDVRTLHRESDPTWVNLDQTVPRWVQGGETFLWSTERNGGWQLELRSGDDGSLVRALTEPGLGYEALLDVDEDADTVWITGGPDPVEIHVYEVPLDGARPPRQLTEAPGEHDAVLGPEGGWVHSAHLEDGRVIHRVHPSGDREMRAIPSTAAPLPFVPRVELATVGDLDYRAAIVRPRDFDPKKKYPVVVAVYGGPHARVVRATKRKYLLEQWIADQGFVVVSADGRGTPRRGREWERAIAGNFIELPMADQVAALEALGARYDELDLRRVGIFGWSFGGYFSAMAVMRRPDVFHAAVAGAPVADWRDYDTHYTERYIGLPDENEEGYRDSSVLTHAPRLGRPLLIIHGTADDNVYLTHGLKMSDALLRAGRPHVFLPLAGQTHMVSEPGVVRRLYARIIGFLRANLGAPGD